MQGKEWYEKNIVKAGTVFVKSYDVNKTVHEKVFAVRLLEPWTRLLSKLEESPLETFKSPARHDPR